MAILDNEKLVNMAKIIDSVTQKIKTPDDAMFVVADGTSGCHNDDPEFHQWLQIVHDDNSNEESLWKRCVVCTRDPSISGTPFSS